MFYILAFIISALLLIEYFCQNTKHNRQFNEIPGLKRKFFIGNILDVLGSPTKLFSFAQSCSSRFRNRGNIFRAYAFNLRIINILEPDDIEVILSSPKYIRKSNVYNFLHSWLKEGLLTSMGEKWQNRRKILTPTFHFNILRQFCNIFVEQSNILVKRLEAEIGKDETVILPYITNFTLQAISETAMGTNLDSGDEIVSKYKNAIYGLGDLVIQRFTKFWLQIPFIYSFSSLAAKESILLKNLHRFTASVISKRRLIKREENFIDNFGDDDTIGVKKRMAMLDLLLKAENDGQINENGIREEVDTFMFEGHDTTTMSLIFTLMLLANHPEAQERIVSEINEIFGDSEVQPTIEVFGKMNYLEMCIKEALRLYPSVPFISRQLDDEMVLKKYTIPPNTTAFIHIFSIHRNPNIYPNPDEFIPERFLPENIRKRHPFAYIPFSAGPRNCIGQRFALLEEKVVISSILRRFKLEPVTKPDDIVFHVDLVLRSENPIKVKLVFRD